MGSQIMAVMTENQQLLEALKQQPSSEEITARVQEKCQEEYDKKLTELVRLNQKELWIKRNIIKERWQNGTNIMTTY